MDKAKERKRLYGLFGRLPDRNRPVSATKVWEEDRGTYVLERLSLDLNGLEAVPAWFTRPAKGNGPFPAVLYCHSHGGHYDTGKEEYLRGQDYLAPPPYAETVSREGYAGLAIDHWVFGERRGMSESETFKRFLWEGTALWGMMVYDSLKALEYLRSRNDVDGRTLVTLGMSMGSTMSTYAAALDEGVKACVDICGQTDGRALIESRGLDRHGIYYYVPGFLRHISMAKLDMLIAPRPHLSIAGDKDMLTPSAGLDRIEVEVSRQYANENARGAWKLLRYPTGHLETAEARAAVREFLRAVK